MVILNWRESVDLAFSLLLFPLLGYQSILSDSGWLRRLSPAPLSFILSTFLRHDEETWLDTAHDRVTLRVPLEESTPKIWSREKEKDRRRKEREIFMPTKWSAGSRVGTPSESEQAVLLETGGRPRAAAPRPASWSAPQAMKKKLGYPLTIFFPQPHPDAH